MRKLATVQRIVKLEPIEGADKILKATVLGWECVVSKNDNFKEGDLIVYVEIDSIMPPKPEYEFLKERKYRIRTIKLRGQVSQGLILPYSVLDADCHKEGDDVTDWLGIKKYDPQAALEQKEFEKRQQINKNRVDKFFKRYKWYRKLFFNPDKLPFPAFIRKTDEERIQNMPWICEKEKGTLFEVTEKLDGQSGTYFLIKNKSWTKLWKPYIFGVCSRNYRLIKKDNSSYWTVAKQYDIENKLKKSIGNHHSMVIQGEIIGNKIQGNPYEVKGYEFYIFNAFANGQQMKISESMGISKVPFLMVAQLKDDVHEMVEFAKGNSTLIRKEREGIVVRNYTKGISFKVINPDYLLKNE